MAVVYKMFLYLVLLLKGVSTEYCNNKEYLSKEFIHEISKTSFGIEGKKKLAESEGNVIQDFALESEEHTAVGKGITSSDYFLNDKTKRIPLEDDFENTKNYENSENTLVENGASFAISRNPVNESSFEEEEKEELFFDGAYGEDIAECGIRESIPCKTIKRVVEKCSKKSSMILCLSEESNKYDTEPITIEGRNIEIKNRDDRIVTIITALDEKKVQQGDALFNLRTDGNFTVKNALIHVNTTRASGRNRGLVVVEGKDASFEVETATIIAADSEQVLNCVLIECKLGTLSLQDVGISHFHSSFALILADASYLFYLFSSSFDTISTASAAQSVITILGGCNFTIIHDSNFSNCGSLEHRLGGVLYLEIESINDSTHIIGTDFSNCSCQSNELQKQQNEGSKGGAVYVHANNDAIGALNFELDRVTFSNCTADIGKYILMSLEAGYEQIKKDKFKFDMEEIYGKPNFIMLEGRAGGANNIVDFMNDEAKRLPYFSKNIYIGGEKASDGDNCGNREEPCDLLKTGLNHILKFVRNTMFVVGSVPVDEACLFDEQTVFSSAVDDCSLPVPIKENNRGILHVGANIKAGELKGVFHSNRSDLNFEHIDIEYPDAVKGDALDIIYGRCYIVIVDVVFRPWYAGLKGESVSRLEGNLLPFKLIVTEDRMAYMSRLVVYGRNGNLTDMGQSCINENNKKPNSLTMNGLFENECENRGGNTENNQLCSWNFGLIFFNNSYQVDFKDCMFANISEGAVLTTASFLNFNNCSFVNNHATDDEWKKFPSLHHNILQYGNQKLGWTTVNSLAAGSDGMGRKPFGMLSEVRVSGDAVTQ
ncbi:uncharacterized protein MONOS_15818 [Monocercomonoides exilis]|uniref:uncharacterized protein n=1 Tax=Monocercomonoides exilis TaxID=2049356 RepID=UPI0035598920|nr:hypothetical protein MONOS_15818 [Monocercomonoides exilis]|eukprot:MONOS_15818.1-p1 / transcript=MONOS_15818.1 / gene=MONOS_15818 / organism=Monocercomonoides_exilis_PA203 / gene_product=unspecified product / transcript_product=unspecified product / location=Mono_scaffold01364:1259-3742(-) / protein_length=828 / sequence_SO=supercontig / SO=protein_coding / is_pseudo=false